MKTLNLEPPKEVQQKRLIQTLIWLGIALLMVWASFGTELSPTKFINGLGKSWTFLIGTPERPGSGFFPPDTRRLPEFIGQMIITIKMAMWGTALAVLLALPLSVMAAKNTTPHPVIYQLTRRLLDFMRGLNEFVLALFFVAAVGLGPFPGILALAIHTAGILAKLFSEGIEVIDPAQTEAVRAGGANPFQIFHFGIWPQVLPHVVSMILYRFESNVRAATVLGLVGAGGIGLYLTESIRSFNFKSASTVIIVILVAVFLVDFLSAKVRERLV